MTLLPAVVFAAGKLDDADFLAAALRDHFRCHRTPLNIGCADFNGFTFSNHQNFVKADRVASGSVQLFQFEDFALFHPVLFATT